MFSELNLPTFDHTT